MKYLIVAICVGLVVGGFVWWKSSRVTYYYPTSGETIVFLGDSLVSGVGATEGRDISSLLSIRLGVEVVNAGVSGNTTVNALRRYERDVLELNPKVVLILLGGNDAIKRIPREETIANLGTMIDTIKARGATVILIGIQGGLIGDPYKKLYRELAKEKEINYIPNILEDLFGTTQYMSDAIHPNDAGYEVVADRIEPVLREVLQGEN